MRERSSAEVYLSGVIGDDASGHRLIDKLQQYGVHTEELLARQAAHIHQDAGSPLATANCGSSRSCVSTSSARTS